MTLTAFADLRQIASGPVEAVAQAVAMHDDIRSPVLILDDDVGRPVELDLREGPERAAAEYRARTAEAPPPRQGRGRPRLGVTAREVTLLPRHWEWLARQPGGASATLRRLVEEARRSGGEPERLRQRQEKVYRVMSVLAGDLPGFEEASRALFGANAARLDEILATWPPDVRAYLLRLREDDEPPASRP